MSKVEWVLCPACEGKTRTKIRHDTPTAPNMEDLRGKHQLKGKSFSDGSGLGLNIIPNIVENHAGSLAVTQDSQKFKVKITLPIFTNTANSIAD